MASGQSTWIGDNFSFTSSSDIIYRIALVSDFSAGLGLDNLFFEPVPEPGTILLIGFGLIGFSGILRRNRDTDYKK
ncbi:PEP-CTERM sorting domain-containing protein [Desulfospira joergensenii]|uniref:PEP-CTERM sorting domain-containing protein n=1 Tax=Desulfospira joergensenii TaxID=53329 RepID=UPI0009FE49D8